MPATTLYKKIAKADQVNTKGGYKNVVYFAPSSTFAAIQKPTATPTVLGDKLKITTAHTFTDPADGFINWLSKLDSVTITGETSGERGAQSMIWKARFVLLGDQATTQEQLQDLLNDSAIFLFKDADCLAGTPYTQLGDECTTPNVKVSFDGKTTAEGLKEYVVELEVKDAKYFYSSTIVEKP